MSKKSKSSEWSTVIEPVSNKLRLNLRELWQYKYLAFLFIKRDFTTVYKQTVLGPLWFIIQPLMTTGIYSIVFSGIAKISTDTIPAPLFYLAGTTIWAFFQSVLTSNSAVLSGNTGLFGKVYFPRLVVPIANSVSKLYQFGIQFVFLMIVYLAYLFAGQVSLPNFVFFLYPILLFQLFVLALGFGLWISAWTVKYRDLAQLVGFGMSLWMWATPIVYPMSYVTDPLIKFLVGINPVSPAIELFRYGLTGAGHFDLLQFAYSWAFTIGIFLIGLLFFNRAERDYVDVV